MIDEDGFRGGSFRGYVRCRRRGGCATKCSKRRHGRDGKSHDCWASPSRSCCRYRATLMVCCHVEKTFLIAVHENPSSINRISSSHEFRNPNLVETPHFSTGEERVASDGFFGVYFKIYAMQSGVEKRVSMILRKNHFQSDSFSSPFFLTPSASAHLFTMDASPPCQHGVPKNGPNTWKIKATSKRKRAK